MGGEREWMTSVYQVVFGSVFLYKYFLCIPVFLRSIVVLKYGVDIISLINVVGCRLHVIDPVWSNLDTINNKNNPL